MSESNPIAKRTMAKADECINENGEIDFETFWKMTKADRDEFKRNNPDQIIQEAGSDALNRIMDKLDIIDKEIEGDEQ